MSSKTSKPKKKPVIRDMMKKLIMERENQIAFYLGEIQAASARGNVALTLECAEKLFTATSNKRAVKVLWWEVSTLMGEKR